MGMLIELDGTVTLNQYVETVKLPSSSPAVGTVCTVYGWGTTSSGGSISNNLRGVNVPVISNDDCDTYLYYRGAIHDGMICMGFLEDWLRFMPRRFWWSSYVQRRTRRSCFMGS